MSREMDTGKTTIFLLEERRRRLRAAVCTQTTHPINLSLTGLSFRQFWLDVTSPYLELPPRRWLLRHLVEGMSNSTDGYIARL